LERLVSIFEIVKGRYWAAIGFLSAHDRDWLCGVYRDGDGAWTVVYRFRYYRDDKAHDSSDERSAYQATVPASMTENETVGRMRAVADVLKLRGYGGEDWIFPKSADPGVVVEMLTGRPWAHLRRDERSD
jgi:hypothetical protein